MRTINVEDWPSKVDLVLKRIRQGETIRLNKEGEPWALMEPDERFKKARAHRLKRKSMSK
jgi:antitoxin (DNA-binding transcriptional repressor) of toxin-antitoxin stability system